MTKQLLQTWGRLREKFKSSVKDKQARIRLLSDKLSETDKELRELEWEREWLKRWEIDKEGRIARITSFFSSKTQKGFSLIIDFTKTNPEYLPSFEQVKRLVEEIRECYCREELKNDFPLSY